MKRLRRVRLLVAITLLGCDAAPSPEGAVGIFYGGQVQELETIVLDPLRAPTLGFRVQLPAGASAEEHQLRWEVVRPGPAGRRVTEVGEARIAAGRAEVEQVLPIDLRESVGLMNVRVVVDGQLVIDRAIDVRKP
jgi:hypothetical protein